MTTPDQLKLVLDQIRQTNVTKTVHEKPYPAILPTRRELSQAGKVVLITGGGGVIGLAIGKAFIRASAATIIIIGRRAAALESAVSELEQEVQSARTNTKIIARTCDMADVTDISKLWEQLKKDGIAVDVFINNAAKFTEPKPMLELGPDEIWSQVEINAKGPIYFTDAFCKQSTGRQKFIVNVTSAVIHGTESPEVSARAGYVISKTTAALYYQLLAQQVKPEEVQIITMEPGLVYNESWKAMGCLPAWFNDPNLSADFAVWAASKESEFFHGRMAWCSWDVDELRAGDIRKRLDEEFLFLRVTVSGLRGGYLA